MDANLIVKSTQESTPLPGSPDAIEQGCTCPTGPNNNGTPPPCGNGDWWITYDCPLHNGWLALPDRSSR